MIFSNLRDPGLAGRLLFVAIVATTVGVPAAGSATLQSDSRAVEIAESALEQMGGRDAWNDTRYIAWTFFGGRQHWWDKWTGNHRMESTTRSGEEHVYLFNVNTLEGRFFVDGEEVTDPERVDELKRRAEGAWINDTYWMFMPYKLLDPGVTLEYVGEGTLEDGRDSWVLQLTFEEVGRTPQNKYLVHVAQDTGLVSQWSYFRDRGDEEPGFTLPWTGWERFGEIMLSTDRGRDHDWNIRVYEELPESVFTSPEPVEVR